MVRKAFLCLALSLYPASVASAATNVAPPDGTIVPEGQDVLLEWTLDQSRQEEASMLDITEVATRFDNDTEGIYSLHPDQTSFLLSNPEPGKYSWEIQSYACPSYPSSCTFGISSTPTVVGVMDRLSLAEAKRYLRKAIYRETHPSVTITRRRCKLTSDFDATCKWTAFIGDVAWKGRAHVWFHSTDLRDNLTRYHADGRYRELDTYCLYINEKPNRKCIDRKKM